MNCFYTKVQYFKEQCALLLTLLLDCTCLEINGMKPFKIVHTKGGYLLISVINL